MDIVSHALAGAASGAVFGHPIVGAVVGVMPDAVLPLQRIAAPTACYRGTHSAIVALCVALLAWGFGISLALLGCAVLAWCSHIALDLPTHANLWAPRLLYPFSDVHYEKGIEWEFLSDEWYIGFLITLIWIFICQNFS